MGNISRFLGFHDILLEILAVYGCCAWRIVYGGSGKQLGGKDKHVRDDGMHLVTRRLCVFNLLG